MREIRQSGSEGGGAHMGSPYPYPSLPGGFPDFENLLGTNRGASRIPGFRARGRVGWK